MRESSGCLPMSHWRSAATAQCSTWCSRCNVKWSVKKQLIIIDSLRWFFFCRCIIFPISALPRLVIQVGWWLSIRFEMFGCLSMLPCIFSLDLPARKDWSSFTFFVSLQEEETPLSAGLLSLHVHGTVCISSWHRDNHEKDKLSETFDQKFCPPPQTLFRHSKTLRDTILWLSHPPQTLLEQTLLKFPPSQTLLEQTFLRFLTLVSPIGTQLADFLVQFQSRFQRHYNHLQH